MIMQATCCMKSGRGKKSLEKTRESTAKRSRPLYMGAVLVITRLVYYALDRIQDLPPPLKVPETVRARRRPSKQKKDKEKEVQEKKDLAKEKKRKREEEQGQDHKHSTRSGDRATTSEKKEPTTSEKGEPSNLEFTDDSQHDDFMQDEQSSSEEEAYDVLMAQALAASKRQKLDEKLERAKDLAI